MNRTTRTMIRKNKDGTYELSSDAYPDALSMMTQQQFEELIRRLEEMRDDKRGEYMAAWFPEFTYRVTG